MPIRFIGWEDIGLCIGREHAPLRFERARAPTREGYGAKHLREKRNILLILREFL